MNMFEKKVRRYMDAKFPILYFQTTEAEKIKRIIVGATQGLERKELLMPAWDGTDRTCDLRTGKVRYTEKEDGGLENILDDCLSKVSWDWDTTMVSKTVCQVIVLENISQFKDDPAVVARLKKFAERICAGTLDATIFIVSPIMWIAPELEQYITVLESEDLGEKEIKDITKEFCKQYNIQISDSLLQEFMTAFKGMSEFEVKHTLLLAFSESGELNQSHISLIFAQKCQILKKTGTLELVLPKEDISAIGGLNVLKSWLERKGRTLSQWPEAKQFGVDMPKGVLIAGLPGCGKSMIAKASASLFKIPLIRLDMGRLLGKYQGESEANMRRAIRMAETISPCVLWIDELEKAFAGTGGNSSGEVATRLLGGFLTWLQEKESAVFVVATANDVTRLPPELLRKGRLDESFYVGLPKKQERQDIFESHINRRRPGETARTDSKGKCLIDLNRLAERTKGYSGADIAGIVSESVEIAFEEGKDFLTTGDIEKVIKSTQSLSESMGEQLTKMENIYKNKRFKNASDGGENE